MKNRVRFALAGVLLLAALDAAAVPVRGLYEASVPVPDQTAPARDPALKQALDAVLVRVTGLRTLPPQADAVRARASALVQGYGYEPAPSGTGLMLHAQFDPRAVEAALRAQGLPVWGANRPSHLFWIALQDDGQPAALLDAAGVASRAGALGTALDERGLPSAFPQLGASERRAVRYADVWSGNFAALEQDSQRYDAAMVVIGRIGREAGRWVARWNVLERSGPGDEWQGTFDTVQAALAGGIDELADREARRFAVQTGSASEIRLSVAGVASMRDYGRALNYLRGLNPVQAAQVESMQKDVLTFRVRVEGDPQTLSRVIAAGNVLRRQEDAGPDSYVLVR